MMERETTSVELPPAVQRVNRLVDDTVHIDTPPEVLMRVEELVSTPDAPIRKLVAVIELDTGLAARVLRLVNSSFYGMKQEISSVQLACVILGMKAIRQLVIQAAVVERFSEAPRVDGFDPSALWRHSFETAVVARFLHTYCEDRVHCGATEAYTCGLLHDVGKMVLVQQHAAEFGAALRLSQREGLVQDEAERQVFGFSAADVARRLAEVWRLGASVQMAVHRAFVPSTHPVEWGTASMVHAASTLAHRATDRPAGWRFDPVEDSTLKRLGITAEAQASVQELVLRTRAEHDAAARA